MLFRESVERLRALCAALSGTLPPALQEDLDEMEEAVRRFTVRLGWGSDLPPAKMVHDLKNPLNVVIGYAEIMLDSDAPMTPKQRSQIQEIYDLGMALVNTVEMHFLKD